MSGISGAAVVTMDHRACQDAWNGAMAKARPRWRFNAGGGWGILIPPSILMVLISLASPRCLSVGLFAAGIGGAAAVFSSCPSISGAAGCSPKLGPALPKEERPSGGQKNSALSSGNFAILIVFRTLRCHSLAVSPHRTEALAIGVLGRWSQPAFQTGNLSAVSDRGRSRSGGRLS